MFITQNTPNRLGKKGSEYLVALSLPGYPNKSTFTCMKTFLQTQHTNIYNLISWAQAYITQKLVALSLKGSFFN